VITDALQTLAGNDIPLGIIPAGTGNDHARESVCLQKIPSPPPTLSPMAGPRSLTSAGFATAKVSPSGLAPWRRRDSIRW